MILRSVKLALVLFTSASMTWAEPYVVHYGTHRTIAVIMQVKRGTLDPNTVVGKVGAERLTAGRLVELFDSNQLQTANSAARGPWFDESKANEIDDEFRPELLFNPDRDFGIGIYLKTTLHPLPPFRSLRAFDYEDSKSLDDYLKERLAPKNNACRWGDLSEGQ